MNVQHVLFPEAWTAEYEDFQKAIRLSNEARSEVESDVEIYMSFGFDRQSAIRFVRENYIYTQAKISVKLQELDALETQN